MKRIILVVLFALFLCGCSKTPQQQILGKWQTADKALIVEFKNDGNVTLSLRQMQGLGASNTVSYSVTNDGHIKIDFLTGLQATFKIDGDTLTITPGEGEEGKVLTLTRIP